MSASTILTSKRGFVRSSAFLAATLALAAALPMASSAATPIALWDGANTDLGNFSLTVQNGNTIENNVITIASDATGGVVYTGDNSSLNNCTFIIRCSGLDFANANNQYLLSLHQNILGGGNGDNSYNKVGVSLAANNAAVRGIWENAFYNDGGVQVADPFSAGTDIVINIQTSGGVFVYEIVTDAGTGARTLVKRYGHTGLKASNTNYKGFSLGGIYEKASSTLSPATGWTISQMAVFGSTLSEAEILGYAFPSDIDTIAVNDNTTVSALNTLIAASSGSKIILSVADGVEIAVDTAFVASVPVEVASSGSITLSANAQPDASYFSAVSFAVEGALLRSWLTPGVVGFNFNASGGRNGQGNTDGAADTALALEIGTWYKDAYSPSGSSTAMFADGLSLLTWQADNVYAEAGDLTAGTFIQGYLDDGGNVSIKLSAVPYETYDVIIYCSTDNSTKSFKAKTVNGTIYTWDATAGATVTTDNANATWGLASAAAGKAVYGANTLRINGLSGPLSIMGGTNSDNARGCISAIQIMPAGTSTAPEMTVGTAGQTTQATWTGANWNVATAPTSGNVIINLSGDVELTVDETVALSAITVNGEGSLTIIPDQPHNVTLTASSISSAIPVLFANDGIGIDTISASITYLYKTPSIKSSTYGDTYTAGVGSQETSVAINHNGGSVVLDGTAGEIYWLSQSNSGTSTAVTFTNATVNYSNGLSVGMANYTVGGASVITTTPNSDNNHSFYLSDGQASRTASFILKDTSVVNVSGESDVDSNQASILFGHWNGPSTFTIQDEAAFNAVAQVLVGKTSNNHTININGGTFTARGIKASASASGANTLNLNGGLLVLGDVGITSYGSTTIGVNVSANSEIRASAATLPISQSMTLGANTTLSFTKANDVSAATVSLIGAVSGSGDISVGPGVTLNLGTNRPEGQITVDEDGVLAIVMIDKSDVPVLHVTAQPATVKLYAVDGVTEYADATVEYDSEAGTITVKAPRPIWNATTDSAFDTVGNWSSGDLPGNGQDATVNFASDTDITVSGTYTLGDLAFTGSGNATVSGEGSIEAASYDFSAATGRIEYKLFAGSSPVISGANTILSGGGSGTPTVAAGKTLTLGPWGTTEDNTTYTCALFQPAVGSTLIFAPGEGKIQKSGGFGGTNPLTTIGITNGTLVVNMTGGGDSVFFGANSVRIDNGGILSLEAQDALGYSNARTLTINNGGVLSVKVRDTLKRTANMNGGTIEIQGENGGRALDFFSGNIINVTANSTIQAVDDGSVPNPTIWFRNGTTVINIDDAVTLANNVTYASTSDGQSTGSVTIRGTMNKSNGNGRMVMNGFNGNPITFTGLATIGESGKPVMYVLNCEHTNGTYVVNAGSRLMGSGSITGNGGVTLAAEKSKICGSLTVNNITATSGGTYGDQWNAVAAKVATSYFAAGTQTIQNGSFTIGANCVVTNSEGAADTTAAEFSIATNGNLRLEKSVTVARLTVADGGTITLGAASKNSVPVLNVAGNTSFAGSVNFIIDFGSVSTPGCRTYTLMTGTLPNIGAVEVRDNKGERRWKVSVVGNDLRATSNGSFNIRLR